MSEVLLTSSETEGEDGDEEYEEETSDEIPASLLSYFEFSRSRAAACEKLVLEDLEYLTALRSTERVTEANVALVDKDTETINETADTFDDQNEDNSATSGSDADEQEFSTVPNDSQDVGGSELHLDMERRKREERDFEEELQRIMEMGKLRRKEADMMELKAQEKLERELRLQQERLNDMKQQVEEELKKSKEEQRSLVQRQEEEEKIRKDKERQKRIEENLKEQQREDEKRKEAVRKQTEEEERMKEKGRIATESQLKEEAEITGSKMEKEERKAKREEERRRQEDKRVQEELRVNKEEDKRQKNGNLMEVEQLKRKEEDKRKQAERKAKAKEVWRKKIVEVERTRKEEEEEKTNREEEEKRKLEAEVMQIEEELTTKEEEEGRSKKEVRKQLEEVEKRRRVVDQEESTRGETKPREIENEIKKSEHMEETSQKTKEENKRTKEAVKKEKEEEKETKQMEEEARGKKKGDGEMRRKMDDVERMTKRVEQHPEQGEKRTEENEEKEKPNQDERLAIRLSSIEMDRNIQENIHVSIHQNIPKNTQQNICDAIHDNIHDNMHQKDITQNILQNQHENIRQNISENIPQNMCKNIQNIHENMQEKIHLNINEDFQSLHENIQENTNKNIQGNIHPNIHENTHENIKENIQENIQPIINENNHANITDNIRPDIQQNIYEIIQENTQQSIHDNIQENIKENVQENIQPNFHENIQESIHENIHENHQNSKDNIQENIPENIHQNINENNHGNILENTRPDFLENLHQNSSSQTWLSQLMDQRRLSWMKVRVSWSEVQNRSRRRSSVGSRRESRRSARDNDLPPLCPDTLLQAASRDSLQEVTILVLEDLPGCNLSTLSQCARLQFLTLRRCGLKVLEGINQLAELCYVDVQENDISMVDCENMTGLRVLKMGHNKLTSIHGLSGAENLDVLELSHNSITRIAGLGSLRRLQRLSLDHNQLVSTKGLKDVCTLLHLDCSHNHLVGVESLESNVLLRTLDLTDNSLTEPPALLDQVLLGELHMDDNSLGSLRCLLAASWLPHLHTLTLARNRLTHLPDMSVAVSLATLDLSFNCLSDVQNVCRGLQGCCSLNEVHLAGNPLQRESSWRCTLQAAVSSLKTIDGTDSDFLPTGSAVARQIDSASDGLLSLIRTQLEQIGDLQRQHIEQLSHAEQASHPLDAIKISCGHLTEALHLAEEQRRSLEHTHDRQTSALDETQGSPVATTRSFVSEDGEGKVADGGSLKSTAAKSIMVQHRAATIIQARWRGLTLRRRLAAALAAVTALQSDDDAFEVVDVEEFVLDEAILDHGWTLSEDAPARSFSASKQQLLNELPGFYTQHSPRLLPPLPTRRHTQAWEVKECEDKMVSPHNSNRKKSASTSVASDLSERSERILEEWGFTNRHTAELMLRRAQKMKSKRKPTGPSGHLEAWRNQPLTTYQLTVPNRLARRSTSATRVHQSEADLGRVRWDQTREWLRNQNALRHSKSEHFLPDISTDAVGVGRRRQLAPVAARTEHQPSGLWTSNGLSDQACGADKNTPGLAVESKQDITAAWRKEERISFRDEPVCRSSGWGGGKKRHKVKH
ncbi:leucine-rich repeat and IQ domain-containing protein 1 [Syngnathus acus]|uniref:leucine-rich repeat and IQ domain-containing protein 1 n=1 Tax=Syngnathus acus TaxID=161584 RepID=UPI001885F2E7|nr:leucine-rich repeat and IQ domain-containing protein 1 [Syngnathus acus]XP_037110744.1 leucine-rich repeat and IQ domain-containing protein 1 [Syngnathus acus]